MATVKIELIRPDGRVETLDPPPAPAPSVGYRRLARGLLCRTQDRRRRMRWPDRLTCGAEIDLEL
jgi:hypothetical protein